ncbi:MAG: NAD(P)H-dependent oxidoreductase [Spirochaetes bacterium]|nr:NAD(P)H-dependent oxidoreductase [Spirochaetota bacterium]
MLVLGILGSPKKKSNTAILLNAFLEEARKAGANTRFIDVDSMDIKPCKEYKVCESKGYCPIKDDMEKEIYSLFWEADLIVMATPVFFYSVPAQLKALIDRSQTQWARKYRLKIEDPGRKWRNGFVLSLGATKGANLFDGINLTAKYFYDAVGAVFKGSLEYRRIENPGDIKDHPTALKDAGEKAKELVAPFLKRRKVLFACSENACRSQMAQAFARFNAGDKVEAVCGGDNPAESVNEDMTKVMAEKGIDMHFRKPVSINDIITSNKPDIVVTMGCEVSCPAVPGAQLIEWDLPDPSGKSIEFMRGLRDDIENKVLDLIETL